MATIPESFIEVAKQELPAHPGLHAAIAAGNAYTISSIVYALYQENHISHTSFFPHIVLQKFEKDGIEATLEWMQNSVRSSRLKESWEAATSEDSELELAAETNPDESEPEDTDLFDEDRTNA